MKKTLLLLLLAIVSLAACDRNQTETMTTTEPEAIDEYPRPPVAERRDHVVEAPAGERVDPWYWLRDDERADADILAYLEAENAYEKAMQAHLSDLRKDLSEELRGRIAEDDSTVPWYDRGYWYYTRFEKGHEYPIYARRKGDLDAEEEILLNVNEKAESEDFYQVGGWDVSMDGQRFAWLEDTVGRRQHRLMIKEFDTGEVIDTGTTGVSSLSWSADNDVLYYVENEPETLRSWRVRRYRVGGGGAGELVYQEDDTAFYTYVSRTKSNAFNFIYLRSTVASEMHVVEAADTEADFELFYPRERGHEYAADHLGDHWIIRTNHQAPNFRIMRVALDEHDDRDAWEDVIAHDEDVFIHEFDAMEGFLAVGERSGGLRRIRIHDWESSESEVLEFDEPAYAAFLAANPDQGAAALRYVYTSMTTPNSTWELDVASGDRELLKRDKVPGDFDSDHYLTRREWVEARDGTRIPVSILHHRDTPLDGTAPLYQYAYGSYGHSSDPSFATGRLSLVDRGFVFAIAHVRGGQEMGRRWYDDGRMLNKINTFTDFIDVTEHLVDEELVDGDRVFAMGGSAGGLLMGAVVNMAPEHYRGVVAHVPFVDVVTTMLDESIPLTTNEFDEWGNPVDPEYYEYMLSYSPYDNVREQDYPAMLVTTGLWDSQVQYWEPAKWVAKLRAYKTDDNPLLLHTNMSAGHGGASGRFRRLEQTAAEYAFILDLAGLYPEN
ncbi:S9 family peptidase [Wenzhouxiangella sp. AB-CW3]|uniref:S9 family peptidase n=1 Tax=Wenzhouxiangella sp. AB-CW3 TaxID=2771012 RepID=UPI00168BBA44|nr:S9 family peptidase [Wenzhouxiangella sp. AB-CW3]QOC23858.1 S9 family peptidase [Wenzhouxiangella sp. AB-CW3]